MSDIEKVQDLDLVPFWISLALYRQHGLSLSALRTENFKNDFLLLSKRVRNRMYKSDVDDMFCEYVGSDDGHEDLCDFIIWNGRETTEDFIRNPKTAIPLAKRMSKHEGFDGDINIIRRIIYDMPLLKKT